MKKSICFLIFLLNIAATLNAQNFQWAHKYGGGIDDQGNDICTDVGGNVLVTGGFSNTIDFDPGPGVNNLTANGWLDVYISKLDAAGNLIWARSIGNVDLEMGNSIAADNAGNVYVAGIFTGTVDFDPGPGVYNLSSTGGQDSYVIKLDALGNFVWARRFGGNTTTYANALAVDDNGNIYTTGWFADSCDFDPGPATNNLNATGYYDAFIVKLNTDGNFVWVKRMGGNGMVHRAYGWAIKVHNSDSVFLTGYFDINVDFDPGPAVLNLNSAGAYDIFVMKLDSSGNLAWAKNFGGSENEVSTSIAVDANGIVATTGAFYGTADFDPGPGSYFLSAQGGNFQPDIFVSKLDASGNFVWARRIGGNDPDEMKDLAFDVMGNLYLGGYINGTVDLDPNAGVYNVTAFDGYPDIIVEKLDGAGNFVWARQMGGPNSSLVWGLALDGAANVYTTGIYDDNCDFDPGPGTFTLGSSGWMDVFVEKIEQCIIDTSVTKNGNQLKANATGVTYQWLDCNNNDAIIPGATSQFYTPLVSGNYAVEITTSSCAVPSVSDTSSCYIISINTGISENSLIDQVTIFPNPSNGLFYINLNGMLAERIKLLNTMGQTIFEDSEVRSGLYTLAINGEAGIYFLQIQCKNDRRIFKLVKK